MRCPICGQGPFRLGLGLRYHTRNAHPDYFSWYSTWVKEIELAVMTLGIILLSLAITGIVPLTTQLDPIIFFGPFFIVVIVFAGNRSRKQREWRRNYFSKS